MNTTYQIVAGKYNTLDHGFKSLEEAKQAAREWRDRGYKGVRVVQTQPAPEPESILDRLAA